MKRPLLLLVALTALLFFDVLFLGRGFFKGDLFPYHYPMKKIVRELGFADGIPQWNPSYHGGQPLAANPAYELFYPPQWLIYAGSYPFAFQLHILVHIAVAAVGMYLLLRDLELSEAAALFGAVTFAFGGPYLSLLIRLPFLFAMTWMPLVIMFARRVVLHGRGGDVALGAIAFGMQALIGEPTTVLQTGAIAGAYVLLKRKGLPRLAAMFAGGLLIAAVHLVPAVDHARDSVRSEDFVWQVASNWSTPPKRLAELAYPQLFRALQGQTGEQALRSMYEYRVEPYISDIYVGLLIFVAAIAGILRGVPGRAFVLVVSAFSILLGLGHHGPFFQKMHDWHLLPSIRYPEKFLLTAIFVLIAFGAVAIDRMARDAALRKIALALVAAWLVAGLFIWIGGHDPSLPTPSLAEARTIPWQRYWGVNLLRGAAAIALVVTAARRGPRWTVALVAFGCLDPAFMHWSQAERISRGYYAEPKAAAQLAGDRGAYRLFHKAAWDEWESDPLAYQHFASAPTTNLVLRDAMFPFSPAAFGFRLVFEDDLDQTGLLSSTELTRTLVDVKRRSHVWSEFLLRSAGVRHVAQFLPYDEARRRGVPIDFRDLGESPRYYFARRLFAGSDRADVAQQIVVSTPSHGDVFTDAPPFAPAAARVVRVHEKPMHVRLEVEAAGRSFLVAAVTRHKYWRATIDGKDATLVTANIGFQGLVVPQGRHVVELRYRNPLIVPSLVVSAMALATAIAFALLRRRHGGEQRVRWGTAARPTTTPSSPNPRSAR